MEARCPPFLIHRGEHALGIAFWAVPHLYRYAAAVFGRERSRLPRLALSSSSPPPAALRLSLLRCTRALLLINADNHTAWNARKRCLDCLYPEQTPTAAAAASASSSSRPLLAELSFLSLVMSKHPKSSEAWSHRRWALLQLLRISRRLQPRASGPLLQLLRGELGAAARAAQAHPKNYLAWCHRAFALSLVAQPEQQAEEGGSGAEAALLREELVGISRWTDSHLSDHSGFHYRALVLSRLLPAASPPSCSAACPRSSQPPPSLLLSELSSLSELQSLYPGHESCWAYRRFLLFRLVLVDCADVRAAEQRFCRQRAAAVAGQEGEQERQEAVYAALHCVYVLELLARRRWSVEDGQQKAEASWMMEPAERSEWLAATERLLAVSDRAAWRERRERLLRLQAAPAGTGGDTLPAL